MNEFTSGHPDYADLLALIDHEPLAEIHAVRRHVRQCGRCREEIDECHAAIWDYAHYEEALVVPAMPAPARPWLDLRPALLEIDEAQQQSLARAGALSRIFARLGSVAGRVVAGTTAIGCVALATVLWTHRETPRAEKIAPPAPARAAGTAAVVSRPESREATAIRPHGPVDGPPPVLEAPMNTEVRVFAALHRLGADLGEPVEVEAPADGRVVVGGTGLPPARQAEIREALAAERDVRFHFADAPSAEPAAAAPTRVEAAHSPLEARLREYAGDDDRYQSLSDRVLDESDTVLAHAHALRTLELRFPAAREAELGAAERTMLHDMAAAHRGAFDQHARSLLGDITPLVKALGAPPLRGVQPGDLLDAAQRTDHALSAIFGAARTDLTPEQMVTELARAASALAAAVGEAQ